jgi:hypothetical protein
MIYFISIYLDFINYTLKKLNIKKIKFLMIKKIILGNKIFINLNILSKKWFHKFPYNFEGLSN